MVVETLICLAMSALTILVAIRVIPALKSHRWPPVILISLLLVVGWSGFLLGLSRAEELKQDLVVCPPKMKTS